MTSGKSTIGPILANVLGWKFYDLDKVIELNESTTIVNIFEDKGEEYFRKIESEALFRISNEKNIVISLGGGTVAVKENLDFIKENGIVIYLKVSPEILYKRLKNKIDRPLFRDLVLGEKTEEEFVRRIEGILTKREAYYQEADFEISTDETQIGVTVDNLAKQIKKLIHEENKS